MAYYKIIEIEKDVIKALNQINNKLYKIRVGEFSKQFILGNIFFGSLVPWNEEWYWSGVQYDCGKLSEKEMGDIRNDFIKKAPSIVYRYCGDLADKARNSIKQHYQEFIEYHCGKDLVIYPDGLSMAADEEKRYRLFYESKPKDIISNVVKKYKLKSPKPSMNYPQHVIDCEDGIAVFFKKDEGLEIFINFKSVVNGLKKEGTNLTEEEKDAIRHLITDSAVSPEFIYKLLLEYKHDSIASSFLIRDCTKKTYLPYLLRKYKGHFYRKRFPQLSFVY